MSLQLKLYGYPRAHRRRALTRVQQNVHALECAQRTFHNDEMAVVQFEWNLDSPVGLGLPGHSFVREIQSAWHQNHAQHRYPPLPSHRPSPPFSGGEAEVQ